MGKYITGLGRLRDRTSHRDLSGHEAKLGDNHLLLDLDDVSTHEPALQYADIVSSSDNDLADDIRTACDAASHRARGVEWPKVQPPTDSEEGKSFGTQDIDPEKPGKDGVDAATNKLKEMLGEGAAQPKKKRPTKK